MPFSHSCLTARPFQQGTGQANHQYSSAKGPQRKNGDPLNRVVTLHLKAFQSKGAQREWQKIVFPVVSIPFTNVRVQ